MAAVWALGKIGPAAKQAVLPLIEILKDADWRVRGYAAIALGEIGPAAKQAVPYLTESLKDEDERVVEFAQTALKKIKADK